MSTSAHFNVLNHKIDCPHCHSQVLTGIGFRIGSLEKKQYKLGDTINWKHQPRRPEERPPNGNVITLGHFNCDNPGCSSWRDCYPNIQSVKITIKADKIIDVVVHKDPSQEEFAILEQS